MGLIERARCTCLPRAFAEVLEVDVKDIYKFLGHNGSEIIWPGQPDPFRRRCFHIQEMIDFSFSLGAGVTHIQRICSQIPETGAIPFKPFKDSEARFAKYMKDYNGVLIGMENDMPHAVALIDSVSRETLVPTAFYIIKSF